MHPTDPSEQQTLPQPEPDSLVALAQAGDVEALSGLLNTVKHAVRRAAVTVLGHSHPDVEDVVQQALIAFVQALPRFRGECQPEGYAARISLRTAVATRRKTQRDRLRSERLQLSSEAPTPSPTPSELSAAARRREVLRGLLEELPDYLADTLALRTVLGYSLEEVASITGAPVNTVRSRMRIAKEALRKRIEADPKLWAELGAAR